MDGAILITGCSTGIGRALCVEFARRGHDVLATARDPRTLDALVSNRIGVAALDVTDPQSIANLELSNRPIAMLVNNAGFGLMGPMLDLDLDAMRRQLETNVVGVLAMTQAVARGMIVRGGGRIVNVSSVSGVLTTPLAGAYCASKAAVNAMSDAMRMELAPFGIRVVTVQPGAIRSSFGENASASIAANLRTQSPYAPIADAIERRAVSGQIGAMPVETFARIAADALLRKKPPALVRIGPHSRRLPLIRRWLSAAFVDRRLSRRFELDTLAQNVGAGT